MLDSVDAVVVFRLVCWAGIEYYPESLAVGVVWCGLCGEEGKTRAKSCFVAVDEQKIVDLTKMNDGALRL